MSERIEENFNNPLKIVCIGDTHFPYAKAEYVASLLKFVKANKPTHIVQIGDLYDQYNFSRYPKEPGDGAETELSAGRAAALMFWNGLKEASPGSKRYQLVGNHCIRMLKKIKQVAPEMYPIVKQYWDDAYNFRGVRTLADDRSELVINDILFIHGYLSNIGDHLKHNRTSVVVGHSHKGGVFYLRHKNQTLFELNCGHIADDKKLPFSYTPQRTTFWTPGFGLIEELPDGLLSARFIPFRP